MSTFTFQLGQKVRAKHSYANILVAGDVYTVVQIIPPLRLVNFTFPEYVVVQDERGQNKGEWYPHRFAPV